MKAMSTRDSESFPLTPDYDPLVLQSNFRTSLTAVLDSLDSVRKCCFLQNLSDSFKKILSCNECNCILGENSTAYLCGHCFCGKCSIKQQTCFKCREKGHDLASQIQNYSKLFEIIDNMRHNFNSESVISEMIKFMVTPLEILKSKENRSRLILPNMTPRNQMTNKKSANSSNISKKPENSTPSKNSKRRLQYGEENEETSVKCGNLTKNGNDSNLLAKSRKPVTENHSRSYLENQTSLVDSSLVEETKIRESAPKLGLKRKRFADVESEPSTKSDIVSKVVQKLMSDSKKRKFNKTDDESKNYNRRSCRRNLNKNKLDVTIDDDKVIEKEIQNTVESQFFGFKTRDVERRFNELETTLKYHKKNVETVSKNFASGKDNNGTNSKDIGVTGINEGVKKDEERTKDFNNEVRSSTNDEEKSKIIDTITEKENNMLLSLQVTEEEEQIDVNVWEKNEQVQRKKKSLFKSVKDCKKRTLLVERIKNLNSASKSPDKKELIQPELTTTRHEQNEIIENARKTAIESDRSEGVVFTSNKTPAEVDHESSSDVRVVLPILDKAVLPKIYDEKPCLDVRSSSKDDNNADNYDETESNSPSLAFAELPVLQDGNSEKSIDLDLSSNKTSSSLYMLKETQIPANQFSENSKNTVLNEVENEIIIKTPTAESLSQEICIVSNTGTNEEIAINDASSSVAEIISVADTPLSNIYSISDNVVSDESNVVSEIYPKEQIMSNMSSKSVSTTNENQDTSDTDENAQLVEDISVSSSCKDSPSNRIAGGVTASRNDERKTKCEKLRKTINDQNQKFLSNVIKSFSVKSPTLLHVEKCKRGKSISPKKKSLEIIKTVEDFDKTPSKQIKFSTPCENRTKTEIPNITPIQSDHSDSRTICNSPDFRSVYCQTTSDLHLSLLMQEFPHFFAKSGLPSSIYDTPANTIGGVETKDYDGVKTPLLSNRRIPKLSTVSSITSSERKLCDEAFERDGSVLGHSFSTPADIESANESYISRLPSTGKKTTTKDGHKMLKLNARLNFELCENIREPATTASVGECIGIANDSVEVLDSVSGNDDEADKIVNASESNVQESEDVILNTYRPLENEEEKILAKDKIDTSVVESITNITAEEKDVTKKDPSTDDISILDENDVDFVAGTPPSYSKKSHPEYNTDENRQALLIENSTENCVSSAEIANSHMSSKSESSQCLISSLPPIFDIVESSKKNSASIEELKVDTKSDIELSQTIYITTSGLQEADLAIVNSFCREFSAKLTSQLIEKTTHVVVKTTNGNRANRTFKYLQAIVYSLKIVSLQWVQDCLQRGTIVDAEEYLPLDSSGECGPLRAFNYQKGLTPSPLAWLRDFCIYFAPPIPKACTLTQLQELMAKAGATVVDALKDFRKYPNLHHIIIVEYDEEDPPLSNSDVANGLQIYQAITIDFDWVLETIGRNRLVPFAEYELVEIPQDILQQYNFPPEMLRYERTEDFE